MANAGGNESIPFVKADIGSLNSAIGRVIGSYFCDPSTSEPRSIRQRLAAGDKSIFTQAPFMPVLLQQMVMEDPKDPKTILRSGVLFTRPYADLPNAVLIQTGLGNNHGIVTSEVAVDSYMVDKDRLQTVVRDKSTRFVHAGNPDGSFSLQKVSNNKDVATTQALSPGVARDLAAAATGLATVYGKGVKKSMDMEYSIQADPKSGKQIIYLLQARPLMDTEGNLKHPKTYLDLQSLSESARKDPGDIVRGKMLLDGNSFVREITSSKQVVLNEELSTALQNYLSAPNRKDIKAIIIKQKAVLTSHEAVTLRPMGVPVIMIENSEEFELTRTLLGNSSDTNSLLICPQRAFVVSTRNIPAASKTNFVKQGLVTFPGALEASVVVNKELTKAVASHDNKAMETYLKGMEARYQFILQKLSKLGQPPVVEGSSDLSLQQMMDLVATGDKSMAVAALGGVLQALHEQLGETMTSGLSEGLAHRMGAFEMLASFSAILEQVDRTVLPSLSRTQPSSMERLYHLKPLEALIFQTAADVINGFSFRSALTMLKTAQMVEKVSQTTGKMRPEVTALTLHFRNSLSRNYGNKWVQFIQNLEKAAPAKINELFGIVKELDSLKMTSMWMGLSTYSFDPDKPLETFTALKQRFDASLQTLQWVRKESETIEHFENTADQWADPVYFDKQINSLIPAYRRLFSPDGNCLFKQHYESANPLGKLAVLQLLGRAMNAYDHIIKAVKGSDRYKIDRKLKAFAYTLRSYSKMMEQTLTLIPKKTEQVLMTDNWNSFLSFDDYTKNLLVGTQYSIIGHETLTTVGFNVLCAKAEAGKASAAEFESRKEFNVAAIQIGAGGDYKEVRWPTTLEEYFTTFHQSMEVAINTLAFQHGMDKEVLSPRTQEVVGMLEKVFKRRISTISFKDGRVEVELNIPLSAHAAKIRVSYDPMDPEERLDLGVTAFGNDENDRLDLLSGALALIGNSQPGISITQTPKIDYRDPIGTDATLRIQKSFKAAPQLAVMLEWLLNTMTLGAHASTVLDQLEANKFYSPGNVDPAVLAYAPGLLSCMMQRALESNNTAGALNTAVAAIVGTAHLDLTYYRNRSKPNHFVQDYIFQQGHGYPVIGTDNKLVTSAQKCLLELIDQMKIGPKDLEKIFTDVIVQKSLPQVVVNLKQAFDYYTNIGDSIKSMLSANEPIAAIGLLKFVKAESDKKSTIDLINGNIVHLIMSGQLKTILHQFINLNETQRKEIVEYLRRISASFALQSEIDNILNLTVLADNAKSLINRKRGIGATLTYELSMFLRFNNKQTKESVIYAAQYINATYLDGEYGREEVTLMSNQVDAKMNVEPFKTLIPQFGSIYPGNMGKNGCSLSLYCLVEGLCSKDDAVRNEAVAQLKLLQGNLAKYDQAANLLDLQPVTDPALAKDRALWKNSLDAVLKHFKL